MNAIKKAIRQAEKNGYVIGNHIGGGVYCYQGVCYTIAGPKWKFV